MAEIGHVVVNCPKCKQPRHLTITAETRPVAAPNTFHIDAVLRGQKLGQIHLLIKHLPDGHRCGTAQPAPGLSLVPNNAEVEGG